MSDFNTSEKFKDERPESTLQRIQDILKTIGITTTERWEDTNVPDCFSLRVAISGTDFGTNGKGTSREFAMASGYAEFMERLQTEYYYTGKYSGETRKEYGFYYAPDEKYFDAVDIVKQSNPWIDFLLAKLHSDIEKDNRVFAFMDQLETDEDIKIKALLKWKFLQPTGFTEKDLISIPFYNIKKKRLDYIPYPILRSTYGSNGVCAGNTPEEALVQGLSEIFERYVNLKIIRERITPPTVPLDYIKRYPYLYSIINEIESSGSYRIIVKDCSLGRGLPVICSILTDLDNQTYRVKFGAHPSIKIALERSLTEMFQGYSLKNAARTNPFFYGPTGIFEQFNLQNIVKTANGYYPFEFFSENDSYEFEPGPDIEGKGNKQMLEELYHLISAEGFDLYIRDVSYLGFPSFHIIAPGCSEIYGYDRLTIKERTTKFRLDEVMSNLHDAGEEDLKVLALYIQYKCDSVLENSLPFIYRLPLKESFFGGTESFRFLLAMTLYKLGSLPESYKEMNIIINRLSYSETPGSELISRMKCIRDYIAMRMDDNSDFSILNSFYTDDICQSTMKRLKDPQDVFNQFYERTNCWDCSNCEAYDNCLYEIVDEVHLKLKAVHSLNSIDQMDNESIFKDFI